MKDFNAPIQSLIDHIKTATDVDPWAKEMAEELLKEQEPVEPILDSFLHKRCPSCKTLLKGRFCHECGRSVKLE